MITRGGGENLANKVNVAKRRDLRARSVLNQNAGGMDTFQEGIIRRPRKNQKGKISSKTIR